MTQYGLNFGQHLLTKCWLTFYHHKVKWFSFQMPCRTSFNGISLSKYSILKIQSILSHLGLKMYLWETPFFTISATLVNTCWPHGQPNHDLSLGTWKGSSQVSFPQILWSGTEYWLRGLRKRHFFAPQYVVGITTFIYHIELFGHSVCFRKS